MRRAVQAGADLFSAMVRVRLLRMFSTFCVIMGAFVCFTTFALAADLNIGPGATMDINVDMTIDGDVNIAATGTLNLGSNTLTVNGDWNNSGTLNAGTSTVVLGGGDQAITGSTTFNNLTKNVTSAATLTFASGTTQIITGTMDLQGAAAELLSLRASTSGSEAFIDPQGTRTIAFLNVQDNNNINATVVDARGTSSVDNGNNTNWIFTDVGITIPISGKTVDTTPTIIGTGNAGDTVEILDADNNVVGSTTINSDGNYALEVTTAMSTGANSLTPRIVSTLGTTINITVSDSVSTNQVPTLTTPPDGNRLTDQTPTVGGAGLANQTVTIYAFDDNGNQLLGTVGSGTVSASGVYSFDLTTNLEKGYVNVFPVVDNVAGAIVQYVLTDPFGIVFDAETNEVIEGAIISIFRDSDDQLAEPGTDLDSSDTNPYITDADGFYSFLTTNQDYYITIEALGYDYPTIRSDADLPDDRTIVTGSRGEVFTVTGTIIEMDHPVDANGEQLVVRKIANKDDVVIGDIVTYTVTVENPTDADAPNILIEDRIPPGFKYIENSTRLGGVKQADPSGKRPVVFDIGDVDSGVTKTLQYQLVVGTGVEPGDYANAAWARLSGGRVVSNVARETVEVKLDPLFDLGIVIGRVHYEDFEGGEPWFDKGLNLGGIRIVTSDGTVVTTDSDGKFSLSGLEPGRHLFRMDERSLPKGLVPTESKLKLVDIRPGLLHKVNFGVTASEKPEQEKRDGPVDFLKVDVREEGVAPRLHIGVWPETIEWREGQFRYPARFKIFTNYPAYIERWKLIVRIKGLEDAEDGEEIVRVLEGTKDQLNELISWSGLDDQGYPLDPYYYEYEFYLEVFDQYDKKDATAPQPLDIKPVDEEKVESLEDFKGRFTDERRKLALWSVEQDKINSLEHQEIDLKDGQLVTVNGLEDENILKIIKEGKVVVAKRLYPELTEGPPVVITGPPAELSARTDKSGEDQTAVEETALDQEAAEFIPRSYQPEFEFILPHGKYDVEVVGGSKAPVLTEEVDVDNDFFFFVGLGDVKMGYGINTGNIEPIAGSDNFKKGFWTESKASFYLEGKILGKYLIKSSFDSNRERDEIFRDVDEDEYYPVYGDSSDTDYSGGDTQGKLFVLVEWDRSSMRWGNFETGIDDTEFATVNRTLFGGKLEYVSPDDTSFGEARRKLIVFQARAKQRRAHVEFTGTGGSLYYLKHTDIVEGSESIRVEVRDEITGLVISTRTMEKDVDYDIDDSSGRIQFRLPVSMLANSDSIVSDDVLDGNPVYVVVDYSYKPLGDFDEGAAGVRARTALGDNVLVGATYVEESQEAQNYELMGTDVTIQPSEDTVIKLEYAESTSEAVGSFVSTDGGLSFTQLSINDGASGQAYGAEFTTKPYDNLEIGGYYKRITAGFSTESTGSQQGKQLYGVETVYGLSEETELIFRHDVQKLIDSGNLQTQAQVGAQTTTTTSMRVIRQLKKLRLTAEYQRQSVRDEIVGAESATNQESNTFAVQAEYDVTDATTLKLKQQVSIRDENTYLTTVGVRQKLTDRITMEAEQSFGTQGSGTRLGVSSDVNKYVTLKADYAFKQAVDAEEEREALVGADLKLDDDTTVSATGGVTGTGAESSTNITLSGKTKIDETTSWITKHILTRTGEEEQKDTTYEIAKKFGARDVRFSVTESKSRTESQQANSNIFGLSGDINDRWDAFLNYERGVVQDLDLNESDRFAISSGFGYQNVDEATGRVKIKAEGKLEYRLDEGDEDRQQYNLLQTVEGQPTENLTLFAKAEMSQTTQTDTDVVEERFRRGTVGLAYRPIKFDDLNLLAKYTFLDTMKPGGQSDEAGISNEKAHVFATEAVYDINDQWQITDKFAVRFNQERVTGFDWNDSMTWLAAQGITYQFDLNWKLYAEYRFLKQQLAKDFKQGVQLEISRSVGEYLNVAVGYELTDFTDDLTNLDYTAHGPYLRVTGMASELSQEERNIYRLKLKAFNVMKAIREQGDEKIRRLWNISTWNEWEAEQFYRKELELILENYHETAIKREKTFPYSKAYRDQLKIELDKAVRHFMRKESRYHVK